MGKSLVICFVFFGVVFAHSRLFVHVAPLADAEAAAAVPLPPDASFASDPSEPNVTVGRSFFAEYVPDPSEYPVRLVIPSIKIDAPVEFVGINGKGEMDVPDGATNNVGWYKYGTLPGNFGSAVMDAHVYAAFKKLRYAKVGSDIYVETAGGKVHHFVVTDARVYTLSEIPMERIFNAENDAGLNFITCAGKFSISLGTYTHRLVVYTKLVK